MGKYTATRWILFPLAAIGSCGATGLAGRSLQGFLEGQFGLPRVESVLPLDAQDAMRYFVEAFVFVVAGSVVAPRGRPFVAVMLLAFGAWLAWIVLGWWQFPENHPRGYEGSYLPLGGCWAGGVVAVIVLSLPSVRRALAAVGADGRLG